MTTLDSKLFYDFWCEYKDEVIDSIFFCLIAFLSIGITLVMMSLIGIVKKFENLLTKLQEKNEPFNMFPTGAIEGRSEITLRKKTHFKKEANFQT